MAKRTVKPRRRWPGLKRRLAGILLATGTLAAAAAWVGSRDGGAGFMGSSWIMIADGQVLMISPSPVGQRGGSLFDPDSWHWLDPSGPSQPLRWRASVGRLSGLGPTHDLYIYACISGARRAGARVWPATVHALVLWPVPLLLAAPPAALLRSGIRARRATTAGACSGCGYSLAGLGAGAKCPECGTVGTVAT